MGAGWAMEALQKRRDSGPPRGELLLGIATVENTEGVPGQLTSVMIAIDAGLERSHKSIDMVLPMPIVEY